MPVDFPDPDKKLTENAMKDPQVGDEFTEMYSFFFFVVARYVDMIMVMEAPPERPCELPRDGILKQFTLDEFRRAYAYSYDPEKGYWVRLCKRGVNVEGWANMINVADTMMWYDI